MTFSVTLRGWQALAAQQRPHEVQGHDGLRGWFEYFNHSYGQTFRMEDGFVRRRMRSILRKGSHRKGSAKGMEPSNHAGPMPTLLRLGYFAWNKPIQRAGPLEGEIITGEPDAWRIASPDPSEGHRNQSTLPP